MKRLFQHCLRRLRVSNFSITRRRRKLISTIECSYTIPNHMSDLAKDLIQRILVVDPLKRATIKDIRNHPWFQMNLPEYLAIPPVVNPNNKSKVEVIDEEVLRDALLTVPDYEFDIREAERAIKQGVMNNLTVAYFLILDHKMKKVMREQYRSQEITANSGGHNIGKQTQLSGSYGALGTSPGGWPHMAQSPPQHQISIELVLDQNGTVVDTDKVSPRRSPRIDDILIDVTDQRNDKNKYHLGILTTSRTSATETMREVYRVLRLMGMKWKVTGPFGLKCKYDHQPHSPNTPQQQQQQAILTPRNDDVIMILQIYKRPEGGYLLDLTRSAGNIFHFHDTCQEFYDNFIR
jgi:5'-AMP-activated protein kinase catalytic alpha subunit